MEVGNHGVEVAGTAILFREVRKGLSDKVTSEFERCEPEPNIGVSQWGHLEERVS